MVAPVFTNEELEGLRCLPEIGREELFRFFTPTPADVAFESLTAVDILRELNATGAR
ncbi:hypothetical protein AB0395_40075 [Streptosporangium sp. NPDC051023]|uniref:hypothetical protein n=1 Tax=Streptosporangium sp. NPDC051023 TaxID=3155410 RepID=UPI00344B33C8